jgi:hypothetical protein
MRLTSYLVLILAWMPLAALCAELPTERGGGIAGQIMIDDKRPMVDAVVLLFSDFSGPPPNPFKYWRIPDMGGGTDREGRFFIPLEDGTYYFMVAQKQANKEIGPPKESEYLYFHGDGSGNPLPVTVSEGRTVDLGRLKGAFFWTPAMSERAKGITAIEGVVVDTAGKPVANLAVFAFYSPETRRRPAFVSDRTDADGRYVLRVAEGGDYWLRARGVIGGGAPATGEHLNTTDDFEPQMVTLETGQKKTGVTIRVKVFEGIGSSGQPVQEKVWKRVTEPRTDKTPPAPTGGGR